MLRFFIVFVLAISVPPAACSSAANGSSILTEGQELSGGNRLISENGKFALGFFTSGSSKSSSGNTTLPNWYVGIWFNKIPKFTPVSIANRERPITDPKFRLSKLRISRDGNLVILSHAAKSVIWSSQIIAAKGRRTTNKNTTIMVALSDNGNLVIRDASNPSIVWWQSFDHPTNVFLPGGRIGRNKVTGQKYSLVSKKNLIDPAPGLYCMELDPTGDPQYFVKHCNSSMAYFSTGKWMGWYFNLVPEMSGSNFLHTNFIDNDDEE
uniref:non-specific serine/threonine protein kinase n=1 Tax=Triticum urartu TaxID=4572 RepID=A0A8R7TBU5_TRIUA